MERVLKISIVAAAVVCLLAGTVMGTTLDYTLINVDNTYANEEELDFSQGLGYYIWTSDEDRTSWHIRWSNDESPNTVFGGAISLQNNEFDTFEEISFEGADYSINSDEGAIFLAWDPVYYYYEEDGFGGLDFTINNIGSLGYVGFALGMNSNFEIGNNIFIGADMESLASLGDDDGIFKIEAPLNAAAPVPEPASMFLMGLGVAGFAASCRRKIRKLFA